MNKKENDSLRIPKRVLETFDEEYEKFSKWSKTKMSKTEFLEFAILQAKHKRANHRAQWQLYSITSKKIGILNRQDKEKVTVLRIHDYLLCKKDNDLFCNHCIYCTMDKDVKKSLNEKYLWYLVRVFRPIIKWPKFTGQKLDFEKIIGNKKASDDWATGDFESIDLAKQLEEWRDEDHPVPLDKLLKD